jgi:hypothetical protein
MPASQVVLEEHPVGCCPEFVLIEGLRAFCEEIPHDTGEDLRVLLPVSLPSDFIYVHSGES